MLIKLPKTQSKCNTFHESDFQSLATNWLKKNAWCSMAFELKVSTGSTINFNCFRPLQIPSLTKARNSILVYKIPDSGLISPAPFDGFCYRKSRAYVGLMFNTKTNRNICYFLDVAVAVMLKRLGYKSISERAASRLGVTVLLN